MATTPPIFKTFSPPMQKLLDMVAESLYFVSEQEMTAEQANAIKERLSRPLGSLGAKHGIPPARKTFTHKPLDSRSG